MELKGQAFILGAVIFSVFLVLAAVSTGPSILGPPINTRDYFSQALGESGNAFNEALKQNRSIGHAKRRMQSYDRFLERRSLEKGITYETYHLILLPEKGEAAFTNMAGEKLDTRLKIAGSWTNKTVDRGQSFSKTFNPGKVSVELIVKDRGESYSLEAATPKLVKHSVMESGDETWENTFTG